MRTFAGIDTHKDTLAVAVVDDAGRERSTEVFTNCPAGHGELRRWLGRHRGLARVGIEGLGSYGHALALELERAGVHVVEVPPHLTARERRRDRKAGKTDDRDTLIIARITLREDDLPSIKPAGVHEDLAALVAQRDSLVGERTRTANRVHGLLAVLAPGYASRCGHLRTAKAIAAARILVSHDAGVRAGIVRSNLDRLGALDREIRALAEAQAQLVTATRTTLTDLDGVGSLVAARILAEVGDVRRYGNRHKFARANGTAPIPASSDAASVTGSTLAATNN